MEEATTQFSTSYEAKLWLENQTSAVLTPVHEQAKKLRDDMDSQIQALSDVSKLLFDTSQKEIEKRNMKLYNRARALNKLARVFMDRYKKLISPEEVSYDSINHYAQETQKSLMVTEIDIKNWFPRISPFFIMDRRKFLQTYEKTKQASVNLNDYVTKEYVKTKTLEEALRQLNDLQNIEKHLASLQEDKENIKSEREPIEDEISELEQKITELTAARPIDKLNLVNAEIENLTNEVKNELRHLQKPFIKMQALATSGGGGGITPDELQKINQYLDNPLEALVSEKPGYPELKEILEKMQGMLKKDTLKLKSDKQRKAEQLARELLKDESLLKMQVRCTEMATRRNQLVESAKMDEIKQKIAAYQDQLEQLRVRKTSVEIHETEKKNSYNQTVDKVSNLKRTIERNVAAALDKRIIID